jgi:HemY protein
MVRLVLFLLGIIATASGLHWLANRPGVMTVNWQGYEVETSVFQAIVILALLVGVGVFAWSVVRQLWKSPATVGSIINRRRERRGLDAISEGMIAIGSGDRQTATRAALMARKSLPNEPLTHLLRAQTAQLQGDNSTSRRIFEAMLASPDTEQLGLRGLFLEAQREGEVEPARQFAERALKSNPALGWPVEALFEMQCRAQDWDGALQTLATGRRHNHIVRAIADRRRAVILTGKAQALEHDSTEEALAFAQEAHKLAPDLVPAAAIIGRILAGKGQTSQAAKVLQKTWKLAPHPELAAAYAYARIGDSPSDRVDRVRQLAKLDPNADEGALALATTAMESRDWNTARAAITPLIESTHLTQRIATLMARIESGEHGDTGRVREWLARAVNAPRDPAWTADGIVSETWAPISPVTGQLDAFQWRVPVAETSDPTLVAERTERLVALGAPRSRPLSPAVASLAADVIDIETTVRTIPTDTEGDLPDLSGVDTPRTRTSEPRKSPSRVS